MNPGPKYAGGHIGWGIVLLGVGQGASLSAGGTSAPLASFIALAASITGLVLLLVGIGRLATAVHYLAGREYVRELSERENVT